MDVYIKDPTIRENIIKAKMYRVSAFLFLGVGFLIFIILYNSFMANRSFIDIFSFTIVFIIAMPFLPAVVLSWVAMKTERKVGAELDAYYAEEERKRAEKAKAIEDKMLAAQAAQDKGGEDDSDADKSDPVRVVNPAVEEVVEEPAAAEAPPPTEEGAA
jgi:hypothetical protein